MIWCSSTELEIQFDLGSVSSVAPIRSALLLARPARWSKSPLTTPTRGKLPQLLNSCTRTLAALPHPRMMITAHFFFSCLESTMKRFTRARCNEPVTCQYNFLTTSNNAAFCCCRTAQLQHLTHANVSCLIRVSSSLLLPTTLLELTQRPQPRLHFPVNMVSLKDFCFRIFGLFFSVQNFPHLFI